MQSTFSRTRHSSKIWAPDISFDSVVPPVRCAVVVDIIPPDQTNCKTKPTKMNPANVTRQKTKPPKSKGHRVVFLSPPDGLSETFVRSPQAGLGTTTVIIMGRSFGT